MTNGFMTITRSDGNRYLLDDGRWLLDFSSGGFGNGSPEVREAVARQSALLCLSSRNFFNNDLALFCSAIVERLPRHQSVFPCNSFDEALDGALKLAKGARPGRSDVVVIGSAPRSRTFYGSRLDRAVEIQTWNRLSFSVQHVHWNDHVALSQCVTPNTYAVVATRSMQSAPDPSFAAALREACDVAGAVLIANEEETGLGALGSLVSLASIRPDVFVFGACLGGIVPFATYAARKSLNDCVYKHRDPVLHATTTGGYPLGCVAALSVLEQIDAHDLYAAAQQYGDQVGALLEPISTGAPHLGLLAVFGSHLFWELHFGTVAAATAFIAAALDRGLLVEGADSGDAKVVRIRLPLSLRTDEFALGLGLLGQLITAESDKVFEHA